jgi:uncharacterized protein (DUF488 family)
VPLFTIGYEGRALDELIAELCANRIDRVIDVRELPLSRRRGFSKTPLGAALAAEDIEYVHLRQAGNPYRGEADALPRFKAHLSRQVVSDVAEAIRGHRATLLCYERHPGECHRSLIAKRVARRLATTIIDL